ncbi:hypothetical protein AZO1586R_186 [Bathymodiolus azoricus thioautotrophic gill symbiont]|uniref:Uncharacterized protein n=1 Tax=Bathymodiolus azoricus thioautotrophic gill symbiont TaxID=235205 RepID=A0ACA8ZMW5_9GAMM|nr:hypothetical protein AZO1586R_186 [Bathymodiolus azoricus thioautotrophic gill symbiont]
MSSDLFLFSFIALLIIFFLFQASEVLFRKLIECFVIEFLIFVIFYSFIVLSALSALSTESICK